MFGLFIGTLCLIGLFSVLRRRRHARFFPVYGPAMYYGGWHRYGHGHGHVHGYGHGPGFGPRGRRGRALYALFQRLDATPGQEKALLALAESMAQQLRDSRTELNLARRDLAAALGGDVLDPVVLDAAFTRGNELFTRASRELKRTLAEAHELLDPEQRKQLAEWIADGSFSPRAFQGYAC